MSSSTEHQAKWVPVDFTNVKIETGFPGQSKVLVVKGETPSSSADGSPVKLEPVEYIDQPDYWRIQVLWDRANAIFQSTQSYEAKLNLDGVTGKKGVEVVGRTKVEKINL